MSFHKHNRKLIFVNRANCDIMSFYYFSTCIVLVTNYDRLTFLVDNMKNLFIFVNLFAISLSN